MEQFNHQANQYIADLFQHHGVDCNISNGKVVFAQNDLSINCFCYDETTEESLKIMQIDVCIYYGIVHIIESFASWGEDFDEVFNQGIVKFRNSSFHVILKKFFNTQTDDAQVVSSTFKINGNNYHVTSSRLMMLGELPKNTCETSIQQFETALKKYPLDTGLHWVRLFYGQENYQMKGFEILLDNEYCQPLMQQGKNFDWHSMEQFYSVRKFMILESGYDINRLARIIFENTQADDAIKKFQLEGLSELDAHKAHALILEAFGRQLITDKVANDTFSHTVTVTNQHDQNFSINVHDEPLYIQAQHFIQSVEWSSELQTVANQSACVHLISSIINDGGDPATVDFSQSATIITIPNYSEPTTKVQKKKPFWKFW